MRATSRDSQARQLSLRLGLWNGFLIGLALALGTWGLEAIALIGVPLQALYARLLLGCLTLLLLGSLGGWLAALFESALAGGLVWFGVALLMVLTIGHLPYEGHGVVAWLTDPRFWGLSIFPFSPSAQVRLLMAGFFVVILLVVLGLIQDLRLEIIRAEINAESRLDSRAWFLLALPLPLVLGVGLIADNLVNQPLRVAPQLVHEAIRTGRTYTGDLFKLSLERSVNYNAIAGVRSQMSEHYMLQIGESDLGSAQTVFVVAHFDNGAWINCRIVADQLSHCYDASPPYQRGFAALIAGETVEDCPECFIRVSAPQREWFAARRDKFIRPPVVTRLAQWGSYVLSRAESPDDGYAIECLFHNISPVKLELCREVSRGS
jgi:hypothetical protein